MKTILNAAVTRIKMMTPEEHRTFRSIVLVGGVTVGLLFLHKGKKIYAQEGAELIKFLNKLL